MITVRDTIDVMDVTGALRDLADRIDATDRGERVVCLIGSSIYVLGDPAHKHIADAAAILSDVVEALPMASAGIN